MGAFFRGVQNGIFRTFKCTFGVSGFRASVAGQGVCNSWDMGQAKEAWFASSTIKGPKAATEQTSTGTHIKNHQNTLRTVDPLQPILREIPQPLEREEQSVHDHHRKKIFWGTFLASKKNFPSRWWIQKPYKNQESRIHHRDLSSVVPIFFCKEKFCTGAGRCMVSFSQFRREKR